MYVIHHFGPVCDAVAVVDSSCMLGSKQAHIEVNSNWAMSGSRTDLKNAVYAQQ